MCSQVPHAPASQVHRQLEERDPVGAADGPEVGQRATRRAELLQQLRKHCSSSSSSSARATTVRDEVSCQSQQLAHAQSTFFRLARLLGLHLVRETFPQRREEAAGVTEERRAAAGHAGLPEQQQLPASLHLWKD